MTDVVNIAKRSRLWAVHQWLLGQQPEVEMLPGRPPVGPGGTSEPGGPEPVLDGSSIPRNPVRAICCSGGGIRSAAFAMGGMQRLSRRDGGGESWYDGVDLVTAVSGGSYIASSFAMVDRFLRDDERHDLPPYAPGSPEDNRLRAHTRYLVDDPRSATAGVIGIFFGLIANLLPLLAWVFVASTLLGWTLRWNDILSFNEGEWHVERGGVAALFVATPLMLTLLAVGVEHFLANFGVLKGRARTFLTAWQIRLLVLTALAAVAVWLVPWILSLASPPEPPTPGTGVATGLTSLLATVGALVGLVRLAISGLKPRLDTALGGVQNGVSGWAGKAARALAPWLGSAIVVLGLLAVIVTVTAQAAERGPTRGGVIGVLVVALIPPFWALVSDINRTSLHHFYRRRLCSAFAVYRDENRAAEIPYETRLRLSAFQRGGPPEPWSADAARVKRPKLVICATVNTAEEGRVPAGRRCAPFTFSADWVGISAGTMFRMEAPATVNDGMPLMLETNEYERLSRTLLTLPAAVAVSGAAVSPVMGRMSRAPVRLLLATANVRLGLWLPNPLRPNDFKRPALLSPDRDLHVDDTRDRFTQGEKKERGHKPRAADAFSNVVWQLRWQLGQPALLALIREMFGRTSLRGRWVYVTDGGHYENLGLVEALRRGATEIVVFDASGDEKGTWTAFGEAVETARADLGVEVDLDPSSMKPAEGKEGVSTLVVQGACTYPNGVQAKLWFCKLALPEELPSSWDVAAWHNRHSSFPNDSTAQQLYGDREFEAYRRLGELAAGAALDLVHGRSKPRVPLQKRPSSVGPSNHHARRAAMTNGNVPSTSKLAVR